MKKYSNDYADEFFNECYEEEEESNESNPKRMRKKKDEIRDLNLIGTIESWNEAG